jgi:transcriptional regulator with XRE-family HTH domain
LWEDAVKIDGAKLKRERERKALSMRDLAERSGVSYVTIWRLEADEGGPTRPSTVRKLSDALGLEPESIVTWDREEKGKAVA